MLLKTGAKLTGVFLGASTLGICLILQARVTAFLQGGTFKSLGPLALIAVGGLLIGGVLAHLLSRRLPSSQPASPGHPSMLADVATEAARSPSIDRSFLLMSVTAPLLAALPLLGLLAATRSGGSLPGAGSALFVATDAAAAFLFSAATCLDARSAARSIRLDFLFLAFALLGLIGGLITASRISSELFRYNELATAAVLISGTLTLLGVLKTGLGRWQQPFAVALVVLFTARAATFIFAEFDNIYERLTAMDETKSDERFAHVLQNRQGVVTITTSGWVHQNGRVQSIFNTNPVPALDINRCSRAYVIPSAIPKPEEILFLGLENSSFAQILAHYPTVKRIVILEENPAYERAVRNSGLVASLLKNERVKIVYGTIASTLRGQGKFDVIIQDRLPFRNDSKGHLLTKEFFEELRSHLKPRGAVYINTLGRAEVERTLVETFPYLLRYQDMIFGSEQSIRVDGYQWMRDLMAWEIDGRRVLLTKREPTEVARHVVQSRNFRGRFAWEREEAIKERTKNSAPLTASSVKTPFWHFESLP